MKPRLILAVLASVGPLAGDLVPFGEDFEAAELAGEGLKLGNEWLYFGNVYEGNPDGTAGAYVYGYGPGPAPNSVGVGFCNIVPGEGGIEQGDQVLTVYSDYENREQVPGEPPLGRVVEANVYQEWTIGAADLGATWTLQFDAKAGNLEGASTALAFVKVLDPTDDYSVTDLQSFATDDFPDPNWGTYTIPITIDAAWEGQLLQIGFLATATNDEGSGVFYDNILFDSPDYVAPEGPRIVSIEKFGDEVTVTFESKSGFIYRFLKADSLDGVFEEIDGDLEGDDEIQFFCDFEATELSAFYRIDEQEVPE